MNNDWAFRYASSLFFTLAALTSFIGCTEMKGLLSGETGAAGPRPAADDLGEQDDDDGENVRNGHTEPVRLSADQIREFGIELDEAGEGELALEIYLPGEVRLNWDRVAHVTPRLSGIVQEVMKSVGDTVRRGEVMAVLESRELATAKAAYFAARERVTLAESTFAREQKLWEDQVSSESDYLEARQWLAETRIEARSAEQQLEALGLDIGYIRSLQDRSGAPLTRFEVTAPFDGTVIEKHIALGEALESNAEAFIVADLGTVWVDVSVYQKHLPVVCVGQEVTISAAGAPQSTGVISYLAPLVGEATRTALARVVLPNPDGVWKPGLFVTATVTVDRWKAPIVVPSTAIHSMDGKPVVFVKDGEGFAPVPVVVGRSDSQHVEVLDGIEPGAVYVARGGFHLKADIEKSAFAEEGHGH